MSSNKRKAVPEAMAALERFKYEVLTSAQNGYVGGYMVKKMIEAQEREMSKGNSIM